MSKWEKIKHALDWAHHAYWISELLISLGIGKPVQLLITKHFSVPPEWGLPLWLVTSGLLFFAVAWIGDKLAKKETRIARSTVQTSVLTIHRATWGTGQGAQTDVTNNLQNLVSEGLSIDVYYENPALGDPAPMKRKRLDVQYSYGNEIKNATISRWERGVGESSRLVLPEDSEIRRLENELEKAKLRSYPHPIFTVEKVIPEGPATSPQVFLKNKIRIILTNHFDREVSVWTPLWESPDVSAEGSPPGSTIQLAKSGWQFDEWEEEKTCITVPVGRSFRSYIALLPTIGESIYRRFETKVPLGTLVFPVKIDGKLYEVRKNI